MNVNKELNEKIIVKAIEHLGKAEYNPTTALDMAIESLGEAIEDGTYEILWAKFVAMCDKWRLLET